MEWTGIKPPSLYCTQPTFLHNIRSVNSTAFLNWSWQGDGCSTEMWVRFPFMPLVWGYTYDFTSFGLFVCLKLDLALWFILTNKGGSHHCNAIGSTKHAQVTLIYVGRKNYDQTSYWVKQKNCFDLKIKTLTFLSRFLKIKQACCHKKNFY